MLQYHSMQLLSADIFFQKSKKIQEYHKSIKQFGSRSGQTYRRTLSGLKLFAKTLAGKDLVQLLHLVQSSFFLLAVRCHQGPATVQAVDRRTVTVQTATRMMIMWHLRTKKTISIRMKRHHQNQKLLPWKRRNHHHLQ